MLKNSSTQHSTENNVGQAFSYSVTYKLKTGLINKADTGQEKFEMKKANVFLQKNFFFRLSIFDFFSLKKLQWNSTKSKKPNIAKVSCKIIRTYKHSPIIARTPPSPFSANTLRNPSKTPATNIMEK